MRFKRTLWTLLICSVFVVAYLFVITSLSGNGTQSGSTPNLSGDGSGNVVIGVGDQIGVDVVRSRWWGTIIETHYSSTTVSKLCLFNIFCLPSEIGGVELIWIHLSVVAVIIFILVMFFIMDLISKSQSQTNNIERRSIATQ